jgi:argininosuccinate lyase
MLHSWAEQTDDVHLAIEARLALERLGPAGPRARQKRQEP